MAAHWDRSPDSRATMRWPPTTSWCSRIAAACGSLPKAPGQNAVRSGSLPKAPGQNAVRSGSLPKAPGQNAVRSGSLPKAPGRNAVRSGSLPKAICKRYWRSGAGFRPLRGDQGSGAGVPQSGEGRHLPWRMGVLPPWRIEPTRGARPGAAVPEHQLVASLRDGGKQSREKPGALRLRPPARRR